MFPAVARISRGGVVCLLAGAGLLAFAVTTNAERLLQKSAPAVVAQVAVASNDAVQAGLPTEAGRDRDQDLRRAILRSGSSGAPNIGMAQGGIAGGDPATSQSFGFEPGEGFTLMPSYIGGQVGWGVPVDINGFPTSTAEGHIDDANPEGGSLQHLRINHDPAIASATVQIGAFSPNMGLFENTSAVVSVDVFITGEGRDYQVVPQSVTEDLVVTRVQFARVGNVINVLDDLDGVGGADPAPVDTGALWIPDQYVNLTIDYNNLVPSLTVSYNNVLIYTMVSPELFATSVQEVVLLGSNGIAATGHIDFDNYDVAGGPQPTGACCNTDGMDLCEILDPFTCGDIVGAFYFGDNTLCSTCPDVPDTCGPGAGDCLVPHLGPGCDDIACCALVCSALPFCCLPGFDWDADCAGPALDFFCAPDPACGVAGTGDCFDINGTLFCDDTCGGDDPCVGCCDLVCALDPFCCDTSWDGVCVTEAQELCGCTVEDTPPNNDCIDAIEVFVNTPIDVSTICGSPDGISHADCNDRFSTGLGIDVWYVYNANFDGALTVTPTPLGGTSWDTQLAIYEGADCTALSVPPFGCAPNGGAAVVTVTSGTSYLIRLGGTIDGPTGVGTLELAAVPVSCEAAVNPCLTTAGTAGCSDLSCCAVVCLALPACCDAAWDQACVDAAALNCAPLPCGPLDVSSANVIEPELCGEDFNGGCNSDPPVFTTVAFGDVIHGTAWADAATRDTDWYELPAIDPGVDVNGNGLVTVTYDVVSELPIVSFFIHDVVPVCLDVQDTGLGTVAYSQSCVQQLSGVATVPIAGSYIIFAGTGTDTGGTIVDGFPCPVPEGPAVFGNNYLLTINVTDDAPPCPWDCGGDNDGNVGIVDFLALLGTWTTVGAPSDCDNDG
ncbi:MAG: hypothetical protein IID28_05735, partial [Planctomycetes bacterium]|nr:hypothetical protein [Planctomycetota bacterium]